LLRSTLAHFEGNCSSELTAKNPTVLGLYEVVYIAAPLLTSVCTKDAAGGYCLTDITSGKVPAATASASNGSTAATASNSTVLLESNTTSVFSSSSKYTIANYAGEVATNPQILFSAVSKVASRLLRRQSVTPAVALDANTPAASTAVITGTTGVLPNAETWQENNVPFLFLSQNMTSTVLCTSCSKSVFAAYIAFEASHPHVLGLPNSALLGQQGKIWTGIGNVCGSGFLQSTAEQAGQTTLSGGAGVKRVGAVVTALSLVATVVAVFA